MDQEIPENETALLNEALGDEPVNEPESAEEKQERQRDDKGRFAKAEEPELTAPAEASHTHAPLADPTKPVGTVAPVEKRESEGIPSWRLAEEANARREAEKRAQELERRYQDVERKLQELDKPKQDPVDIFQDPDGFQQRLVQDREALQRDFQKSLRAIQLESNLQIASIKHGENFEKAYAAFQEASDRGDHATCQRIINSPNPGDSMVKWYRDNEVLREVGNDPAAYRQKLLDEAMNDESFLAKVVDKIKGKEPGRPAITKLPPSLSRAPAGASNDEDAPPMSDRELLDHVLK